MLVRSYRTVSPLPPHAVAVCFLWHCPASHLGLPLAITPLCEVRTFLETPSGDPRPPSQLVRTQQRTASYTDSATARELPGPHAACCAAIATPIRTSISLTSTSITPGMGGAVDW